MSDGDLEEGLNIMVWKSYDWLSVQNVIIHVGLATDTMKDENAFAPEWWPA